ncbi:nuclear transport factor 2 family protein [Cupriavidus necator]|uniref:SnoaL-like domain-containing protein n=1 Tax=Cupriavidus pinatubonensis (strain JMP 134 / LMG 1197) TaxID=264198 RepID=Q46N47_CUPPJ|nr:nuclear transport factor 2 family protein [Cupriavidus necator]
MMTDIPHNQFSPAPRTLPALLAWYGALSPSSLERLDLYYASEARFCDPFNEVCGIAAIRTVFEHMFETVETPRFAFHTKIGSGAQAFVAWTFTGRVRQHAFDVPGCTHLSFDEDGLVTSHQDFWDAATLWRQLPLIRFPATWLCKRFSAKLA